MQDNLPVNLVECCGVMNLDVSRGPGIHWTAWYKDLYFDSYGFPQPEEFLDKAGLVRYNDLDIQKIYDPPSPLEPCREPLVTEPTGCFEKA